MCEQYFLRSSVPEGKNKGKNQTSVSFVLIAPFAIIRDVRKDRFIPRSDAVRSPGVPTNGRDSRAKSTKYTNERKCQTDRNRRIYSVRSYVRRSRSDRARRESSIFRSRRLKVFFLVCEYTRTRHVNDIDFQT